MATTDREQLRLEAAAEAALPEWGLESARAALISSVENLVFRVETSTGERFVLRAHRPSYHDLDELVSEQQWTAALLAAGIDVPVPRPTLDGRPYARAAVSADGRQRVIGLSEWVDGVPMRQEVGDDPDPALLIDRFRSLGNIAATIHNQATSWQLPSGFRRHALDADGLMGESPFWGRFWDHPGLSGTDQALVSRLRCRIHTTLHEYGTARSTYSLIHADLHPGNVIVDGERLHLIDFDDAGFGWHQYELAVALFSYDQRSDFDALRDALVAGYRAVRPLNDADLELLPLLLLARALASIGWVADRPELAGPGSVDNLMASVRHWARVAFGDAVLCD